MINLKKGNTNLTNLTGPAAISSATLDTMRINMSPVTNIHLNTSTDPKEVEVHYPGSDVAALAGDACSPGRACHPLGRAAQLALLRRGSSETSDAALCPAGTAPL